MTIVNLYRRYKRWNPVHPTCGAFWGFGLGIGCGVGWGPGFGPEVIGYTGAGCGVGFSVGVTLLGCGVGLPASGLTCLPCDAMLCASNAAFDLAKAHLLPPMLVAAKQGWTSLTHQAASLEETWRTEHPNLLNYVSFPPIKFPLFLHHRHAPNRATVRVKSISAAPQHPLSVPAPDLPLDFPSDISPPTCPCGAVLMTPPPSPSGRDVSTQTPPPPPPS